MGSTPTLTPIVRQDKILSASSPLLFLSPTSSSRRPRLVSFANQAGVIAGNDDATEIQQRHVSRVTDLVLQSPRSMTPKSASRLNSVEGSSASGRTEMTNTQLKDLHSNCVRLSTENKINAKNAFDLPLIDYMQALLTNMQKDQGATNFQIASCTLDASAKIYAGRVDSLYTEAYKMLGDLGRAENVNEESNEGVDCSGDSERAPRKKKARKVVKTIETNLNNINADQVELQFEFDPVFQKTSASFDEGGTGGLLLNHLNRRNDFCETLLDCNTKTTPTMADFDFGNTLTVSVTDMRDMKTRLLSPSVQICSQFADFSFNNWDSDVEVIGANETSVNNGNEHAFDMDAPATFDPVNDMHDMGARGFDDDDDGDMFDDGAGNINTDMVGNSLAFADGQQAQMRPTSMASECVNDLGRLVLSLSSEQNEYSYFKLNALPVWAGPGQWKKSTQLYALKGCSKNGSQKKNSMRKKVFSGEFNDETHDVDKHFVEGKVTTVLTEKTMNKHASDEKTLPDSLHYEFNSLMKSLLKFKVMVQRQYGVLPAVTDDGSGNDWYDFGNANDCANYCADVQGDDGDDDVSDAAENGGFNEDSTQEMSQAVSSFNSNETVFQGDNLVAQPNKVQKIDIAYSRTAKTVDVKRVKDVMWDIMTSSSCDADKENIPDNMLNERTENDIFKESISKTWKFIELYNAIPNKISEHMAKNLSVPIAFVCLLHLVNEKKLKLDDCESMDDLTITQEI